MSCKSEKNIIFANLQLKIEYSQLMLLIELIIELIVDLMAVCLGVFLMCQPRDNYLRFHWGLIVTLIGLVFIWENVEWISILRYNSTYEFTDILCIEKMLKWYFLASLVVLFPTASLRPGYMNLNKILVFLLPTLIITTIGSSYMCFNGTITQIDSIWQLFQYISNTDVKLRLAIFLSSVFTPLVFFIYPLMNQGIYRRANRRMYLFVGFLFLLFGIYMFFTLSINTLFFNAFGIACIVFALLFSVFYLRYENPFSMHIGDDCKEVPQQEFIGEPKGHITTPISENEISIQIHPIFNEIDAHLKRHNFFVQAEFRIDDLSRSLGVKESVIYAAVRSCGYTTFKEYLNHLRMEYFKQQAIQFPERTIKELMLISGFSSKSTFYRIFKDKYGISPIEFIDNQLM